MTSTTKTYSRPRPFVGLTSNGRRECLASSTSTPPKKGVVAMVGPFKTNRGAAFYCLHPSLFFRSVNHCEELAAAYKEARQ